MSDNQEKSGIDRAEELFKADDYQMKPCHRCSDYGKPIEGLVVCTGCGKWVLDGVVVKQHQKVIKVGEWRTGPSHIFAGSGR